MTMLDDSLDERFLKVDLSLVHHCLGAALSRLELSAAYRELLNHCDDLALGAEPITWQPRFVIRGLDHLPVVASPIKPALIRSEESA